VTPIDLLTWEQLKILLKAGFNPRISGDRAVKEEQDPDAILAGSGGAFALIPSFPYNVGKLANTGDIIAPDKYKKPTSRDEHVYLNYILSNYINDGATHNGESWVKFEKDLDDLIKDKSRDTLCYRITEGLFACFNSALLLINNSGSRDAVIWMTRADTMMSYDMDSDYGEIGKVRSSQKTFWHQRYVLDDFPQKVGDRSAVKFLLGATVKMAKTITSTPNW
jgi:hypothetical protein